MGSMTIINQVSSWPELLSYLQLIRINHFHIKYMYFDSNVFEIYIARFEWHLVSIGTVKSPVSGKPQDLESELSYDNI